jgi:hypothetical protein
MGNSMLIAVSFVLCMLNSNDAATVDYCQAELRAGNSAPPPPGKELAFAVVIARHGDRTPASVLPDEGLVSWNGCGVSRTDTIERRMLPGSTASFSGFSYSPASNPYARGMWRGDCADGQLTSRGAKQHTELGASLRARYVQAFSLIPPIPDESLLSLRSSDVPRTRESAEHMIAALLPRGIAGAGPIPLGRRPWLVEDMIGNPQLCPRFAERRDEIMSSATWREREKQRAPLRKTLDSILGTAHADGW